MTNKKIIFSLALFALLLSGCAPTDDNSSGSAYIGGTQGLVTSFSQIGINNEITQDEPITIEVSVKNRGEYDLDTNEVKVYLENTPDFDNIVSTVKTNDYKLSKRSVEFEGEEAIISFSNNAKYNSIIPGAFREIDLYATTCYPYRTVLEVDVCHNTDYTDDTICVVNNDNVNYQVSGAPLQVTRVREVREGKNAIALYIDVDNQGGGQATGDCDNSQEDDKISFTMATDEAKWTCRYGGTENEAKLRDEKTTIKCTRPLEDNDNYEKSVILYLNYKYTDTIKQRLKINKVD